MSRFVLTAQLQLRAPTNTRQVLNQIQRQLGGGANVNVNINNAARAQGQLNQLNNQTRNLNTTGQRLGRTFGVALRRFTAFAVASRGVSLFTSKLGEALSEAIDFQRELVKVSQVTGKTLKQLDGLSKTITKLSINLGVSSKDILSTTRILAQAGIQAKDLDVALSALAKTALAPTFENIEQTAEGAIAILAQFGKGVGALETQLGSINAVAGQFAVESGDLIGAIRRTGGVFKSAGGTLEEFLGLFTSVRATTRESSESIATGLRTIFTRIQRPKTIEFLKRFGVQLTDLEGKFVGPFEAVKRLSTALSGLGEGDIRFVQIAEELGGFRQIGKVIPLLQQFEVAERARQAAIEGGTSLNKDYITAQQALAVQFTKVREEFLALVRGISETGTFQILIKTTLALTSQLIKLADAFKPILPILGAFAAIRIGRGIGNFISGIGAGLTRRNAGGPIGFAAGGVVPGAGNRDTVPAMLTPGEFVIRKSSVSKIGTSTLAAMNENRYNDGGKVSEYDSSSPYIKTGQETFYKNAKSPFFKQPSGKKFATRFNPDDKVKFTLNRLQLNPEDYKDKAPVEYKEYIDEKDNRIRGIKFENLLKAAKVITGAKTKSGKDATSSRLDGLLNGQLAEVKSRKDKVRENEIGNKVIGGAIFPKSEVDQELAGILTNKRLTHGPNTMDFGTINLIQDERVLEKKTEPKTQKGKAGKKFFGGAIQKFAKGGSPSDTVPALLTPGEFVVNEKAAASIGKANLDRMNKHGVAGFAAGGQVTRGRHTYGSPAAKGIAEEVIELLANASKAIPKPESSSIPYNQDESNTPGVHQGFENYKFDQRSKDYRPGSSAGKAAREHESMQFSEKINFGDSYFGDPSKIQKISGETFRNGDEHPFSWEEVGGLDFSGITTPEIAMATLESGLDELFGSVKDVPAIVKQFGDSLLNTRDMMQSLSETLHENGARISDDYNANEKIAEEKEKKKLPSGIAAAKREEIQKKEQEIINSPPTFQDFFARSPKDEETQDTPAQGGPEKKTEPIVARVSNLVDTINKSGEEAFRNIFEKIDRATFSPNIKKVSAPVRKRPESEAFSTKVRKGASQFAKPASDTQIASFISGEKSRNVADPSKIKQGFGKTAGFTVGPPTGFKAPTVEEKPQINRRETDLFEEEGIEQKRASSTIPKDFDPLSFDEKAGKKETAEAAAKQAKVEELKALTGRSSELAGTTKSQEALANDKNVSPEISGLASALVDNTSAVTANDQVISTLKQEYRTNNAALMETKKAYEQAAAQSEAVKRQEQGGIDSRKGRIEEINSNLNKRDLSDEKRSALLREKGNLQDGVAKREGEIAESEKPAQELAKQMQLEEAARDRVVEALLAAEDSETELLKKREELKKTLEEQIVARRTSLKQSINTSAQMDATAAGQTGTQSSFGEFSKTATKIIGAKKKEQQDNDLKSTFNVGKSPAKVSDNKLLESIDNQMSALIGAVKGGAAKGGGSVSEKTSDCDECSLLQSIDNNIAVIRKTAGDIARLIAQKLGGGSTSTEEKKEPKINNKKSDSLASGTDESRQNLGALGNLGAQLFGINAVLSNFTVSGEEAANKGFALANALSTAANQYVVTDAALREMTNRINENVKTRTFTDKQGKKREAAIFRKGSTGDKVSKGIGNFGDKLSDMGSRRGGKTGKLLGNLGGKFKGLGKIISKIGPKLLSKLPIIGRVIQTISLVSTFLKAGLAIQDKYNKAIKEGNVAEAERYAVSKDLTGIEQGLVEVFGSKAGDIFLSLRGASGDAARAIAKSSALTAKANLDQAKNAELASEALEDLKSGSITAYDALAGAAGSNIRNFAEAKNATDEAIKANEEQKSGEGLITGRNILTLGGVLGESSGTKNKRIDTENEQLKKEADANFDKALSQSLPVIDSMSRGLISTGGNLDDFKRSLQELFPDVNFTDEQMRKLSRSFENTRKVMEENKKVFQAMNLGTRPLAYAIQGVSAEMDKLSKVASGSYNTLADASNILKAVATGAKVSDATFKSALDVVTNELEAFGGAGFGKISDTLVALEGGFSGARGALDSLRNDLLTFGIKSATADEFTDRFIESMLSGADEGSKDILRNLLADLTLSDSDLASIANGNFEPVLKKLEERGGEVFKELEPILNSLVSAQKDYLSIQNQLTDATRSRIEAEKNAINLQKEAASIIAEFSDKTLTASEQVGFADQSLATSGITDTSASGLSARLEANTQSAITSQDKLSRSGQRIDPTTGEIVKDESKPQLSSQEQQDEKTNLEDRTRENDEILAYARERVKIYQQEIAAAKQRLKLDQDAAKALLSGDVSKFAESTNASIAASAFRMGDTAQLQGLSGEALATGFDSLTDEEKAASAGTLESLGLSSGLADAASGTSPEIQKLQEEGKMYAEIIAQSGDKQVDLANAAEAAAKNLNEIAKIKFEQAQEEANQAIDEAATAAEDNSPEAIAKRRDQEYNKQLRQRASETDVMLNYEEGTKEYEQAIQEQMDAMRQQDQSLNIDQNNFATYAGGTDVRSAQRRADQGGTRAGGSMRSVEDGPGLWEGIRGYWNGEFDGNVQYGGGAHTDNYGSLFRKKGGTIYASRGMFIPKGTDTVPAMLTPGEFVVNRAAVQRGNNLQLLRAMNGGDTASNGAPAPSSGGTAQMAAGGMVGYFNEGGQVAGGMGEFVTGFSQAIGQLGSAFGTFAKSVENLSQMKLSVDLAPTSVNVNVIGPMLSELTEQTKEIVLNAVVSEIKLNQLGNLERTV